MPGLREVVQVAMRFRTFVLGARCSGGCRYLEWNAARWPAERRMFALTREGTRAPLEVLEAHLNEDS